MSTEDKRLARIEQKIDDQNEHLGSIDTTLVQQHVILAEHIRRTELLEKDIQPIKRHVYMVQGAFALITLISLLIGIWQVLK